MSDTRLKSLIERIERLIEERVAIGGDIRDIFTEAKSAGYVPKAMRKVIARRAMDASDLAEEDALIEAYEAAAGAAGVAAKLVAGGATIDEAAEKTGVPRSTVGFLKAPAKIQQSENLDGPAKDATPPNEIGAVAAKSRVATSEMDWTIPEHLDRRDGVLRRSAPSSQASTNSNRQQQERLRVRNR